MKFVKSFGLMALFFSLSLFVVSCSGNQDAGHSHDDTTHTHADGDGHDHDHAAHGEGKAFTAAYVCPMHCENSGSEEPGKCPVCNMDYVAQAEHTKDGHTH